MKNELLITCRHLIKHTGVTLATLLMVAAIITGSACLFAVGYGVVYKPLSYPAGSATTLLEQRHGCEEDK